MLLVLFGTGRFGTGREAVLCSAARYWPPLGAGGRGYSAVMPWALIRSAQRLASAVTSFWNASGELWAGVMPWVSNDLATAGDASAVATYTVTYS